MPTIAVLTGDLMFFSQVAETARRAGFEACQAETVEQVGAEVDAVVVELRAGGDPADLGRRLALALPGTPLLAFGPHVQKDLLEAARTSDFAFVGRRSEIGPRLPDVLRALAEES
jgi:hypothetical protein